MDARLDLPPDEITEEVEHEDLLAMLRDERVERAAGRWLVSVTAIRIEGRLHGLVRYDPLPGAEPIGELSRRFEVGSKGPGAISTGIGDPGGKSYGSWQMTSQPAGGTVSRFVDDPGFAYFDRFRGMEPGTGPFDAAWTALAAADAEPFRREQHAFILREFFVPAAAALRRVGFDVAARSATLRDVLWSTAVQHGPGRAAEFFAKAAAGVPAPLDAAIVDAVYAERGRRLANGSLAHFQRSSAQVQASVARRFVEEAGLAREMLAREEANPPTAAVATGSATPAWFAAAAGEVGVKEKPGSGDHPRIREYFAWTALGEQPDSVPWCGAFVAFCFGRAGLIRRGSGSARAADWLAFGRPLDTPVQGCLVVLEPQASGASGHVGFLDRIEGERVFLLGGNQKDAVNVAPFPRDEVRKFGYRWPG